MTTLAQGMISISSEMEGYTASLTNDSISIATDKDGNNPVLNGASTTATLALGATTVQAYIPTTIGGFSCSGCTISVSGTTISLVTVTADTGYVDIPIYSNSARTSEYLVVTKRFSFSKSKQGNTGAQGLQGLQGPQGDQGIKGNPGANGVSSYTHIAYSTSPTGATGFSTSNSSGATYIGMYVDTVATDSLSPSKYKWTLIKGADGTQGIQGPTGPNGKTSYLHIAYATNSTGTTGFSTTDSVGKTYIGQYTDFVAADSTTASTYSWTLIKGADGTNGINALTGFLTNESSTIPTDKDGNNGVFTTATTTMKVYNGITDDSANWSYSATPSTGVTGSLSASTYTVTAMTQDSGYVDITASRSGYANIIKRFTITKNKAGLTGGVGASATSYWLVTSTPVIAKTIAEIYSPSTITITGKSQVGTNSPTDYKGRFIISDSIDGSTFVDRYTSSSNESTKTYTPLPGIKSLKIKFYLAGGTTILLDEQTIQVVADPSDLSIGGRNLVLNSNFEKTMTDNINTQNATISLSTDYYYQGSQSLKILITGTSGGGIFFPITGDYLNMCKGKVTTYSFKAKGIGSSIGKTMNATIINSDGSKARAVLALTDDWQTISVTALIPTNITSVGLYAGYGGELTSGDIIYIDCVKYELGNKATDWTPAPEDTDIAIENAINNIQVGGRNLVLGSGNYLPNKTDTWIIDDARHWSKNLFNGYIRFTKLTTTAFSRIKIPLSMTLEASTTYTATIKFRRSIASNIIVYIANLSSSSVLESIINTTPSTANEFTTVTRTFTTSIANTNCLMLTSTHFTTAGETFDIEYIKIEKGNKPTDWTPAPEDEGVAIDNAIGNIQVGGRNYARYSGGSYLSREGIHLGDRYRASITNVDGKACLQILNNASTPAIRFLQIPIPEKAVYTFSIWIKGTTNHSAKIFQWATNNYDTRTFNVTDSWAKYSFTFTALTPSDTVHLLDFPETTYISDWKFELGNKATDWSPAPEDVQTSIDKAQQSADGKNLVFYQTTAPSTTERVIGDTWFDTDDGNKIYRWNGTEWAATQFGTNAIANSSITNALIADATISSAKISALDAGKITTGYLSANRISGGTLSLGGGSNGNGVLSIKDSSNVEVVRGDNSGLLVDGGSYRIKDEFGNVCSALKTSNLIANGGFELYSNGDIDEDDHYRTNEIENWDPTGTVRIASIGSEAKLPKTCRYEGQQSVTMTNNGKVTQPFGAFAGTTYTVSFCARLNPVKSSKVSSGNVKVSLFKYHTSGTIGSTASYTKTFAVGQAWTRCIYTFVASDLPNNLSLDALILELTSATTAWVIIDCVQVVEGNLPCLVETEPPGNVIAPGRIGYGKLQNGNYFTESIEAPWRIYAIYKYISGWTLIDYSSCKFTHANRIFTTPFQGVNAQALVKNDTLTSCHVALSGSASGHVYIMVIGY